MANMLENTPKYAYTVSVYGGSLQFWGINIFIPYTPATPVTQVKLS
jgi:hypothetical protein